MGRQPSVVALTLSVAATVDQCYWKDGFTYKDQENKATDETARDLKHQLSDSLFYFQADQLLMYSSFLRRQTDIHADLCR